MTLLCLIWHSLKFVFRGYYSWYYLSQFVDFLMLNRYGNSNFTHIPPFSYLTCWFWLFSQILSHLGKIVNFQFWIPILHCSVGHVAVRIWLSFLRRNYSLLSLFSFLNNSNWSFVAQVIAIWTWLAGLA